MEYLAGGTVADAIRVGAVRRQEAVRWIREAASALDHAHARGIVHRDIKPANFLLNRSRVLHVADFGIARLVSEDTITSAGELFGTAAYLSPEQALGREATGASDRYALAVAAFELLAGERPFDAPHFAAQARQHIEDSRPRASERDRTLPPAVDDVLIRGMAKEPERALRDRRRVRRRAGDRAVGRDRRDRRTGRPRHAAARRHAPATSCGAARAARAERPTRPATAPAARRVRAAFPRQRLPASARPTPHARRAAARLDGARGRRPTRSSAARPRAGAAARIVALVALLVVIAGVGALALRRPGRLQASPTPASAPPEAHGVAGAHACGDRHAQTGGAQPPPRTAQSSTHHHADDPAHPPSAEQLQLTGHNELLAGNYPEAIPTLRKAISAADPASITYAYGAV